MLTNDLPPSRLKEWSDTYGSVFSLKIGKGTFIVLNSRRAVHDLVDKKSAIYLDRPLDYNIEVAMRGENLAFMHADSLWRAQRKIASQNLAPRWLDEKVVMIQEAEYVYSFVRCWVEAGMRVNK
jgi:cytochrome P450